jgi:uncharacterized membrane protein YeaQ/YmgE (transglycosylase-associated protein family)
VEQTARETFLYMQANPAGSFVIALLTGFAACKSVASDWKGGLSLLFVVVGLVGFFLGQFMVLLLGLKEILDQIPQFTWLFDLIIGFVGSFIVATIINFFKPT